MPRAITFDEPQVLVWESEHGGPECFAADTAERFAASCLYLLRLFHDDYQLWPEERLPPAPDFTAADVEKMPASMQEQARQTLRNYARTNQWALRREADRNDVVKALADKDGKLAWEVLRNCEVEYHRVRLQGVRVCE